MHATRLLQTTESLGIRPTVAGGTLRFDAPKGAMSPELRDAIVKVKPYLMVMLSSEPPEVADPGLAEGWHLTGPAYFPPGDPPFDWDNLRQWRWGPGFGDPMPGLDVHPPIR